MKLPMELIDKIIGEIVDTPAIFVFDVVTGSLRHSPTSPDTSYRYMSFRPRVNPPGNQRPPEHPGTFESQVSKTIRALILTNKSIRAECLRHLQGINVPTANGQAVVRFNPRKHIICLYRFDDFDRLAHLGFMLGRQDLISFAWHLTDLNFDIDHLGFMSEGSGGNGSALELFQTTFPTVQHIYAVVAGLPRKNPSQPVDFVSPAHDPTHALSPMFLHIAKRSWNVVKGSLFSYPVRVSIRGDWEEGSDMKGLVLI